MLEFALCLALLHTASADFISLGSPETCALECPNGPLPDCCCSFDDLRDTNVNTVHKLLKKVVKTPFFSHFMMDPCQTCTLWEDDTMCEIQDCGVCECKRPEFLSDKDVASARESDSPCQRQLDSQKLVHMSANDIFSKPWTTPGEVAELPKMEVVDLLRNPELYTGYNGSRIWNAIHHENCFKPQRSNSWCEVLLPAEQRLYNKLLAGLHSSISLHIAAQYCVEIVDWQCQKWEPSLTYALSHVLSHPDRVEALYFIFAVVLRAVIKAVDQVVAVVPSDPKFGESSRQWSKDLLPALKRLTHKCPHTFDESLMFVGTKGDRFRDQIWRRFRHLRDIIKCVGCDRCKLWGTLQTLGLGSALKVLFPAKDGDQQLTRQEAVALVNVLERLSSALQYVQEFRDTLRERLEIDNKTKMKEL